MYGAQKHESFLHKLQQVWLLLMASAQARCDRDTTAAVFVMYGAQKSGSCLHELQQVWLVLMARPSLDNY
jgi:hypothetical protein